MRVRTLLSLALASLPLCVAAQTGNPNVLGTVHATNTSTPNSTQTVTIMKNGTVHATVNDNGVAAEINLSLSGDQAAIVRRDALGVSSTLLDLNKARAFEQTHAQLAKVLARGPLANPGTSRFFVTRTEIAPLAAAGDCSAEATDMINAGYAAIAACSWGSGIGCAMATSDYNNAVATYHACMARVRQPPVSN